MIGVTGVSLAVHQSYTTREEAIDRYLQAVICDEVAILPDVNMNPDSRGHVHLYPADRASSRIDISVEQLNWAYRLQDQCLGILCSVLVHD